MRESPARRHAEAHTTFRERGEYVAAARERNRENRISRVTRQEILPSQPLDVVILERGCLGLDLPTDRLIVTGNHPILFQNARRPAKCFEGMKGVTRYKNTVCAKDLLTPDEDGKYVLYDLQFDDDGTFV